MSQRRQRQGGFRFSLPWVTPQTTPQRQQSSRVPTSENSNQQRNPNSPPRAQESTENEMQKKSPSKAGARNGESTSRVGPQSTTVQNPNRQQNRNPPPRAQESTEDEMPKKSPSRAGTLDRIPSHGESTSRTGSKSTPVPKLPSSPFLTAIKPQPIAQPSPSRVTSQARVSPLPSSPSRPISEIQRTTQTGPQSLSPPTLVPQPQVQTKQDLEQKPEANEDKAKQPIGEKSDASSLIRDETNNLLESNKRTEETIKGKELIAREHNEVENIDATPIDSPQISNTPKEQKESPDSRLAGDKEQKQVEEEEFVNISNRLAPSSSTKEHTKTIISQSTDKDGAHISHHENNASTKKGQLHKEIKDDISRFIHKMSNEQQKLPVEGSQVSVITLTGENRGASMQLGSELREKEGKISIRRGYKVNPHESNDSATDGEKGQNVGKTPKGSESEEDETKAYINSNIQSVNNSIMSNSSITERDPGIHYSLSRKLMKHADHETKSTESLEAHKAEYNIAPAQKLSYKPVVRRRCLKGLFMEPSDSENDNPDKPRRHGCRVGCGEKSNNVNDIEVL